MLGPVQQDLKNVQEGMFCTAQRQIDSYYNDDRARQYYEGYYI